VLVPLEPARQVTFFAIWSFLSLMTEKKKLREIWERDIRPGDYEAHMAAIGQAEANASLVAELFEKYAPADGARILFAGAGTGPLFDLFPASALIPFNVAFSDINSEFLERLAGRLAGVSKLKYECIADDIEDSQLAFFPELVIAVLVLEHVDWRKAIATMCRLATKRVFVVVQENPIGAASPLTHKLPPGNSLSVLSEVKPHIVPVSQAAMEFGAHGFAIGRTSVRELADSKRMLGIEFYRAS
jgi:hypothetical protein